MPRDRHTSARLYCWLLHIFHRLLLYTSILPCTWPENQSAGFFWSELCISLFRSFSTLNDSISVLLLLLLPLMMMSAQCMLHVICLLAVGVLQLHFTFKLVGTVSITKWQLPVLISLEMRIPIVHGKKNIINLLLAFGDDNFVLYNHTILSHTWHQMLCRCVIHSRNISSFQLSSPFLIAWFIETRRQNKSMVSTKKKTYTNWH